MLSSSSAIAIGFIWQLFKLQIKKNTPHAIIIFCHCHRLHLAIDQAQIKKNTPHAIIIFCHCHRLHLAIVQATNKEEHATCYHHLLPLP